MSDGTPKNMQITASLSGPRIESYKYQMRQLTILMLLIRFVMLGIAKQVPACSRSGCTPRDVLFPLSHLS